MGVIHIKNRVTRNIREFEESRLSDCSLLYVDRADNVESFSLELYIGTRWSEKYGTNDNTMFELEQTGIDLAARGSIVIEISNEITVPHNMYGIIVPTGSLFLDKGVIIAAAKIEPSFHGKLKLRLVNTLNHKIRLKPGYKVASAIFFGTETTEIQKTVTKDPAHAKRERPLLSRFGHWMVSNKNQVISWMVQMLSGAVMATILMTFVIHKPSEKGQNSADKSSVIVKQNKSEK